MDVSGVAVVDADVGLEVLVVDDAQEEQLTGAQQHAVRLGVLGRGRDPAAIPVPRDPGGRVALRLAVQRGRLVLGNVVVVGVLHDPRVAQITCNDYKGEIIIKGTIIKKGR